jgi:hypothetical protein
LRQQQKKMATFGCSNVVVDPHLLDLVASDLRAWVEKLPDARSKNGAPAA